MNYVTSSLINLFNLYYDMYYDILVDAPIDDKYVGYDIENSKFLCLAKTKLVSNNSNTTEPLYLFECKKCGAPVIQTIHTTKENTRKYGSNSNCGFHSFWKNTYVNRIHLGSRKPLKKEFDKLIKYGSIDGISYNFSIYWNFAFWAFKTNYQPGQTLFRFNNNQIWCEHNCYWGWELSNLPIWDNYKKILKPIKDWNSYLRLPEGYIENEFFIGKNIDQKDAIINTANFIHSKLYPFENCPVGFAHKPPIRTYNSFYLDFRF